VIERERNMACQPGSSGGSAEGFLWRLRRAIRIRSGVEVWCSSHDFLTSWRSRFLTSWHGSDE
jgi:hypothetical protein